jgi:cytochrome b
MTVQTSAYPSVIPVAAAESIKVWDLPVRLFHWLLVAAIAVAFVSADDDSPLSGVHMAAGWVAAVLIAFRLVWGFVGGEHARFADFLKLGQIGHHLSGLLSLRPAATTGHNPLGGVAVVAMLATVGGVVYSGAAVSGGEDFHEALAYLLVGLIALHVAAVVLMSLLTRENLVRAFVTGRKTAALHPGARDARAPSPIAVPVGAIAIAAAAYGITQLDPTAFAPGARAHGEASEAGGAPASGHGGGDND